MRRRSVQRTAVALSGAMVVAAVFSTLAWAVSQQYNGQAANGVNNAGVEFGGRLAHGHPVQVVRFRWFNVPVACGATGRSAASDDLPRTMNVNASRRFHATSKLNGGLAKVTVNGRFSKSFGRATGTLRITGTLSGCSRGDSGVVRWTAPKTGRPS